MDIGKPQRIITAPAPAPKEVPVPEPAKEPEPVKEPVKT